MFPVVIVLLIIAVSVLGAYPSADPEQDEEFNGGVHKGCGGKWKHKGLLPSAMVCLHRYECDKCRKTMTSVHYHVTK